MYTKPMRLDEPLYRDIGLHNNAMSERDSFGIEVELEGLNIKTTDPKIRKFWTLHEDGSLRANIAGRADGQGETAEYVSVVPFDKVQTFVALKTLFDYLNSKNVTIFQSYRTSIHVHVNCGLETYRTIYNYIALCIIFDELLSSINGHHRIGNNFCLRFVDAEGGIEELARSIEISGNMTNISMNMRYSSINFASIYKFGTIEFRSLECTTDFDRVTRWINTVQKLKEAARGFQNPTEIIGLFSRFSTEEFGHHILGDYFGRYKLVPNYRQMLRRGMRLAQDFAYSATWEAAKPATKKETKKVVNRGGWGAPEQVYNPYMAAVPQPQNDANFNAQIAQFIVQNQQNLQQPNPAPQPDIDFDLEQDFE